MGGFWKKHHQNEEKRGGRGRGDKRIGLGQTQKKKKIEWLLHTKKKRMCAKEREVLGRSFRTKEESSQGTHQKKN